MEAVHNLKQITASNRNIQTIEHFGGLKHLQILYMGTPFSIQTTIQSTL